MINMHDDKNHADITHCCINELYSTEPPEAAFEAVIFYCIYINKML